MLLVSVKGALAYTDWQQPLETGKQSDDTISYLSMHYPLASDTYVSNCSIPVASYFQLLSDSITHNVWVEAVGTLDIYSKNCTLIDQIAVNGTSFGGGFIYDYDTDNKPNILFPVKTPDTTITIQGFELDGTSLSNDKNIDLGSVNSCSGIVCDRSSGYCAVFCDDGKIKRINVSAGTYTEINSTIGVYDYLGTSGKYGQWSESGTLKDLSPIKNSVSYGDVDDDGNLEILYYNPNSYWAGGASSRLHYWDLMLYDITSDIVQGNLVGYDNGTIFALSYGGGSCGGSIAHTVAFVGAPAIISRIGAKTSIPKILYASSGMGFGLSCAGKTNIKVFDYNWNVLHSFVDYGGQDYRLSNFVTGDYDSDNLYEYCFIFAGKLWCFEPTYTHRFNCSVYPYNNTGAATDPIGLTMLDYISGGVKEFATVYDVIDNTCNSLYDFGMTVTDTGALVPVDLTGDNKLDLMHIDSVSGTLFLTTPIVTPPPPEECEMPECAYPCIFYDFFNYTCYLEDMDWTLYPSDPTLQPENGKLCKDSSGVFYAQKLLDAYVNEQIISTEFDMTIYDGITPINEFVIYDGTDDEYKTIYYLWWEYNGSNTILYYHKPQGGSWVSEILCVDCWSLDTEHHYKIVQYHHNTEGDHFYNISSGQLEPILTNSYYVIIDNNSSKSFYNLPNRDALNNSHSNLLNDVTWRWYNEKVCIDNVQVYAGTQFSQGEFEEECPYHPVSYEFPILWADYFQYNDRITRHGWGGYPFVVGDNPYDVCDILYYDRADYGDEIYYDMSYDVIDNFEITFDLFPDDDNAIGCYADGYFFITDVPASVYNRTYTTENNLLLSLKWDTDCKIHARTVGNNWSTIVGNYHMCQGLGYADSLESYKIIVDFDTQTYDFYFTNCTSPFSYQLGCANCSFVSNNVTKARAFRWFPDFSTTSYGWWLDTISLRQTEGYAPSNVTNFCYFDGCIFHDHFDYDDSTYGHGWYMHETIPVNSIATLTNQTYGYYFDHTFDVFRKTDGEGIVTVQFYAMIPEETSKFEDTKFLLYGDDYNRRPLYIDFGIQTITAFSANNQVIGHFNYDKWYLYSFVLDLNEQTFDFYIDGSKSAEDVAIEALEQSDGIAKVGFKPETDSIMLVDFITVAEGTDIIDDIVDFEDTGVPSEHLRVCWDEGDFDWTCCSSKEQNDKSLWCPFRVTILWGLASTTVFALKYILYVLILAGLFVLCLPIILHLVRGEKK